MTPLGQRPFALKMLGTAEGLVALALLVAALVFVREMGWVAQPGGALYALGFLLVAGTIVGRTVALVGLPRLTGYLAVGVLSGPHGFGLFGQQEVEALTLVNALALALIALQAGAELTLPMLRRSFKSLAAATASHTVIISGGMVVVFALLSPYMPFLDGLSLGTVLTVALVWGALAVSKAATDALAILSETRSKGPVSEHALGVVILVDVCVLVLFATAMMMARASLDPLSPGLSREGFAALGVELFSSVAAGTTFGLGIALYFRVVGREHLLFLAVVAYAITAFTTYFHYDTLLVFVVAGFVVMNLTQQGGALIHTTERAATGVMVVFFATAGAQLDLGALKVGGVIAVTLAAARIALTWIASQAGHALARDPPVIRRYGFSAFISQAGVTLGLASIAREQLGDVGVGIATLLIAVIGINEVIGPIAFKVGLSRAGEVGRGHLHHEGATEGATEGEEGAPPLP